MRQLFPEYANSLSRASIVGAVLLVGVFFSVLWAYQWSSYATGMNTFVAQPVPFSHLHHVRADGIDCRYCHTSVESSAFAGIPPTDTCMNCHAELWSNAEVLEPVRRSWRTGEPLVWQRVYNLPDFTYFNHGIHLNKGIGCISCHGRVDLMPLTNQAVNLRMAWCLDCHRNPEPHLRLKEELTNMEWAAPADPEFRAKLAREYRVEKKGLTDCWTCHR